ncbi:c-type cytochrome [Rhodovulum kholense]|uniref:Cbb3-type cytochrome c oxidase subunit III n=1 Tax=Rhodovulum kholense TaxID=453584 RepID=A0A8E2VMP4_9RHOB|nr:cytochrome c [Rhodovulum kholense]PTW51931.1 cbb3-type cytochrome c oxidase subunit III [Rhodovulum kholense]
MKVIPLLLALGAGLSASCVHATGAAAPADAATIERGAYLARIMDCAGCHMPRGADGVLAFSAGLSGGTVGFEMPGLGIFWPPNLTPDATGLGDWSADQILTAIRAGIRPDGRVLAPVMPWASYAGLTDEDGAALVAYLQSLAPVAARTPPPAVTADRAAGPFFRVTLPSQ